MTPNTRLQTDPTGELKLVNSGFSQIYDRHWSTFRALVDTYPTALKVFTWLIEKADKRNALVASYATMSKGLGLHERTIRNSIGYLKENNLITVLKSGNMNVYYLNDQVIWKDTADRKDKFSQFSAEVIITASEQEEAYRTQLIGHAVPKVKAD
jgi:DNA-binding transcriptional ArsR family regulator